MKLINVNPCRLWRDAILSQSGKFWKWARLRVDPALHPSQDDDLLSSRILYLVTEISLCTGHGIVRSLMEAVSEGKTPMLRELSGSADLFSVSPEVLVGAIKRLEKVQFSHGKMTAKQINTVLRMVRDNQQGRMKEIVIYKSGVPGWVLSTLLSRARLNNAVRIELVW